MTRCRCSGQFPCGGGRPNTRQMQQTNDRMTIGDIWQWTRWLWRYRRHAYQLTHDIYEIRTTR